MAEKPDENKNRGENPTGSPAGGKKPENGAGPALWLPVGMSLGLVFGLLFDQLALGISLGLCFGAAIGAMGGKNKNRLYFL